MENNMKHGLKYYARIYMKLLAQGIKSKMSYREDFIISMIGMLATNVAGVIGFWIVFQNFPRIAGWNYYEMLFLYGFCLIASTPAQCLFDNNWNLRIVVYNGDFIKYCFRPMNLFFYFMSEVFDIKGLWQFAFGIGSVVFAWTKLSLPFYWYSIPLFIVAALSASLFVIAILNAASATCFWITHSFFVLQLSNTLRDYANYPVSIFGKGLRILFTYVIPIAFISYYPCMLFIRPESVGIVTYLTPVLGIVFFWLSYKLWMKGAMEYNGTGS